MRIDADSHVDETEATWEYLGENEVRFKPTTLEPGTATLFPNSRDQAWQIDGEVLRRPWRNYDRTGTSPATNQLLDVGARLRHMDDLRIDVQVIYPTTFIRTAFVGHAEMELALTRSYNRWIAARTAESRGRLRWVAVLPMLTMESAVDELRWARDHGACGVYKKGLECDGKTVADPYFFPLYEEASRLDMAVCIHTGSDGRQRGIPTPLDAVVAFPPLIASPVFDQFPNLRVGFIEASASWVPFLLSIQAASGRHTHLQTSGAFELQHEPSLPPQVFVACQSQDDLPYILRFGTEDNLLVGTDYAHADQTAELVALDIIERRAADGEFPVEVARKILDDNPRRFYGI